jgi:hypothetical protein
MNKFAIFAVIVFYMGIGPLHAQDKLQSPAEFLGYPLGTQFTQHSEIIRYTEYLAAAAPFSVQLQRYGSTYQGRPLVLATFGTEANMSRIEDIRKSNLRRTGLLDGQPDPQQPAIVWLSYNVHGNESVSSEAVLQVMYDLANPENERVQQWLANTIVLVDPCVNPDGRERYVQWYKQVAGRFPDVSPWAREHNEPWPGGRPNHYLFDLNRDWAWQTQQESRQRIALYNLWMPHLHADFHEMGVESPYYFSPAAKPLHEDITPWQREFQYIIGDNNRKYFDANNWLYFTRENFDIFYPSYGDSWPTFNGAIAMTYEQGGSGRAGLAIKREQGDTLTLSDRIAHHYAASLATIEAVAERSGRVVAEFQKYYDRARQNPAGEYKTYVFKTEGNAGKIESLIRYLDRQEIRYGWVNKATAGQGFNFANGQKGRVNISQGDLGISMYQPKSTLVKVLFEPSTVLEDSVTYDITSWALPYAYGLEAVALRDRITLSANRPAPAAVAARIVEKPYAYVARWSGLNDLQFLTGLLASDIKVRYAEKPFETDGQVFQPGTLIITRSGNEKLGDRLDEIIQRHAVATNVALFPVSTGFVTSGADFGSGSVRFIKAPKVAVVAGPGISSLAFGEVWHFFEQQIHYPVTVLETSYVANVPLAEFDVLIMPSGNYSRIFDAQALERINTWLRGGGKLIALESAAGFLAGKPGFELRKKEADTVDYKKEPYRLLKAYGERERASISEEVQGSIYRINMDNTHPLAYGYGPAYYALMREPAAYRFLQNGWNVGVLKRDNYVTGFAGADARRKLQDTFVFGTQPMGRGQVVYMLNSPLFRGFWHSGKLMFGNAVFFVGQ